MASPTILVEPGTREAILDAAERRFADAGVAGVSVREIAADAGLKNQASLYHYFGGKQAIYEAVLARGIDSIVRMLDAAASPAGSGADLDRVLDYLGAHPHLARLLQRAGLDDDAGARTAVARIIEPLYARGVGMLEQTDGLWSRDEIPHLAAGLYHLIFGYFASTALLQPMFDDDLRSPEAIERQRRFVRKAAARLLGLQLDDERA